MVRNVQVLGEMGQNVQYFGRNGHHSGQSMVGIDCSKWFISIARGQNVEIA